jgi:hypothetical protein
MFGKKSTKVTKQAEATKITKRVLAPEELDKVAGGRNSQSG